jgi:hypothetical protein
VKRIYRGRCYIEYGVLVGQDDWVGACFGSRALVLVENELVEGFKERFVGFEELGDMDLGVLRKKIL